VSPLVNGRVGQNVSLTSCYRAAQGAPSRPRHRRRRTHVVRWWAYVPACVNASSPGPRSSPRHVWIPSLLRHEDAAGRPADAWTVTRRRRVAMRSSVRLRPAEADPHARRAPVARCQRVPPGPPIGGDRRATTFGLAVRPPSLERQPARPSAPSGVEAGPHIGGPDDAGCMLRSGVYWMARGSCGVQGERRGSDRLAPEAARQLLPAACRSGVAATPGRNLAGRASRRDGSRMLPLPSPAVGGCRGPDGILAPAAGRYKKRRGDTRSSRVIAGTPSAPPRRPRWLPVERSRREPREPGAAADSLEARWRRIVRARMRGGDQNDDTHPAAHWPRLTPGAPAADSGRSRPCRREGRWKALRRASSWSVS
jgi:hypothetical protein